MVRDELKQFYNEVLKDETLEVTGLWTVIFPKGTYQWPAWEEIDEETIQRLENTTRFASWRLQKAMERLGKPLTQFMENFMKAFRKAFRK